MSSSGSVKLRYEICLVNWVNASIVSSAFRHRRVASLSPILKLWRLWIPYQQSKLMLTH